MNKIKINDSITVNDTSDRSTIKGIVKLFDESGHVIFEKHNMVVKTGRELIYNLFNTIFGNAPVSVSTFNIGFSYLADNIKTTATTAYSDISSNDKLEEKIASSDITKVDNDLVVTFKTTINGDNSFKKFNQIYLFYKIGDNTKLFSRVAMPPTFISSEDEYTLEYSLYF